MKGAILAMILAFGATQIVFGNSSARVVSIIDRLPRHSSKRYGRRDFSQIQNIVIHHSASDGQTAWDIARFHVTGNHLDAGGAPAIAYHFFLSEDGTIYQTNSLDTVSWHVKGHNTESIGICLSGNLDNHPPTSAQKNSLKKLTDQLKGQFPKARVLQHKDLRPTSCAGKYFDIRPYR